MLDFNGGGFMKTRNSVRFTLNLLGLLLALPFLSLAARAQAFVSARNGVDTGTCPVTAPCRSITWSLSQAVEGGMVNVIDSGLYEPFVVNKSVTVQAAPGVVAVITRNTAGPGISIETENSEYVTIRGLTLNLPDNLFSPGGGAGSTGLSVTGGGTVAIERCIVRGFTTGIEVKMIGLIFIRETQVSGGTTGISLNANYLSLKASLERCATFRNTSAGLNVTTSPSAIFRLTAVESQFSGTNTGVRVAPDASGTADVNFENCTMAINRFGLSVEGAGATVRVSDSTITDNGVGVTTASGATLLSRGNNTVEGNSINGNFTGTFSAK
jgi:Right handed beta helix region